MPDIQIGVIVISISQRQCEIVSPLPGFQA
jgi:hypothetical protein